MSSKKAMASASCAVLGPCPSSAKDTMGDEPKRSMATIALLVLACCHAALTVSNLSTPHDDDDDLAAAARGVETVRYLASMVSTVVATYVASAVCGGGGSNGRGRRRRPRIEDLLAEARPMVTTLYIELLTTAMASLLLTLWAFLGAAAVGGSGSAVGLLTAFRPVALVGWLAPVLFAHSDIACRMSLVMAAVEEGGYAGRAVVHRAKALVSGRRARGFAVGLAAAAIEQVPAWLYGDSGTPALVLGPTVLVAKIAACCACTAFYYDCRRRQDRVGDGGGALKFEEASKCCEVDDDAWDMADGCESEGFWSTLACFRLM